MQENTQLNRQEVQAQAKRNTAKIKDLLKEGNYNSIINGVELAKQTNALFTHEFLDLPERLEFFKMGRFYKRYITSLQKEVTESSLEAHKQKDTAAAAEWDRMFFELQNCNNYFGELSRCLTLKL